MAQRGIQILIAIIPPDSPGTSKRIVYDPDFQEGLMAFEVAQEVRKLLKKIRKPKKEDSAA